MQRTEYNTQDILYRDFARAFKSHALTNDVIMNENEMAVREAIVNIIFTNRYERPYSSLGVGILYFLFEPMGLDVALNLQDRIRSNIVRYEPRANLIDIKVVPDYDGNAYDITIVFSLINTPTRQFSINFALKRIR